VQWGHLNCAPSAGKLRPVSFACILIFLKILFLFLKDVFELVVVAEEDEISVRSFKKLYFDFEELQ